MGMPAPQDITTIEELFALPEDFSRHELIGGVHYVTPSPIWRHQRAVREFYNVLEKALSRTTSLEIILSPADLKLGPRTVVQPDLFVVPAGSDWDNARPVLVIEVLSPSTASRDREIKRRVYLDVDAEYWVVNLDARIVERWRPGHDQPELIKDRLECSIEGGDERIDLAALFARVWAHG